MCISLDDKHLEERISFLISKWEDSFQVVVSEIINTVAECRVYVIRGEIKCYHQDKKIVRFYEPFMVETCKQFYDVEKIGGFVMLFGVVEKSNSFHTVFVKVIDGIFIEQFAETS